ncbi:protoporphyrinogen oxidase [Salisediminibacterium selenitireducens]|uniref:Coproporphyrinogen III oxidase n=1 Tax=Bacillus selenitireducens (strain ATCC 700615 / DSM 15326 / MLS10) TaxID=439292 RepID=D6XX02_BACIE|nr:protoporphyrinogen oxidase [Salisediminibacterium selenitireducens]ADH99978.1 protoporphyrinogen oxidase [[Bacillus] selenitireducens MLS10]
MTTRRIAVIGGGITGLSAAFYLQKEIEAGNIDAQYTLYEAKAELGGRIETVKKDGFTIETGPDSFLARKQSMTELAKDVGMADDLVPNEGGSFILSKGRLHKMPEGAVMGIPTKWGPFISTTLFSPVGKARAAFDLVLPKVTKGDQDISLGEFFRRRLGDEVVDHMIDPLLSGIYAGNIDEISLHATFPHFQTLEEKYRSLIIGMKTSMAKRQSAPQTGGKKKPVGMFLTFKNGLSSLVSAVEDHLDKNAVKKGHTLTSLTRLSSGRYELRFSNGTTDVVDEVILTTPHQHIEALFKDEGFGDAFTDMPSTSVATVAMAFPADAVKKDIDGTGFVVSKKDDYEITACTWTHKKWVHAAPKGYALLRAYVGKRGSEAIVSESDETIKAAVLRDLNRIMDIEGEPLFSIVTRWEDAMPQYTVGHRARTAHFRDALRERYPGVLLAGASLDGIGLPDCIDQGKKAVELLKTEQGQAVTAAAVKN